MAEPAYRTVYHTLKEQIEKKIYDVGDTLPTEPELEKTFGFSRTTIRKAIAFLAEKTKSVTAVRLEPYHPYGLKKYEAVGAVPIYDRAQMMEEKEISKARDLIASMTKKEVII